MDLVGGLAGRVAEAVGSDEADSYFECVECGHETEAVLTACPACDGLVVRVVER
jgi:Zn finger protein HypA/HybF involved in hydrogenase expression